MPFSDATAQQGLAILRRGKSALERVEVAVELFGATDELHRELRSCLVTLRSAMDWLEDTPRFELAHQALDRAGKLARHRFGLGCNFVYENGEYYARCPVSLAHNRVGLSAAMVIGASHCSACGLDPLDCDHVSGFVYDGEMCHVVITEIREVLEISVVSRPNFPDARIVSMSIATDDLISQFGASFEPGTPVSCDRCLKACAGVRRPFESSNHG